MKKIIIHSLFSAISLVLFIQVAGACDQGIYIDISEPSPIADRTIPLKATTNPIAFTVSDSDGGPLIVECTSSNPNLVPNNNTHIFIEGKGRRITIDAAKNEKKHLTARIVPSTDQPGTARLTFKVIDSGGLFATKSMNLTVTAQTINPKLEPYAFVPSSMIHSIKQCMFSSEQNNFITLSVLGNGHIRMGDQIFDDFQKIMTDSNQQFQIKAQPAENWQFAYWSGDVVDTQNPLNLVPDDQLDIQAVFISNQEQQQSTIQGWRLHLFLTEKQTQEMSVSEIFLGVADSPLKIISDQPNPTLSIVTDSGATNLSDQLITDTVETFWLIRVQNGTSKILNWEFDQQSSGSFELLDAMTHEVYVSDMKTIKQFHIPERLDSVNLLIHYLP